jgi:hypothetical protein
MREYVEVAGSLPFSEAYPILAWVIGNAVARYSDTEEAGRFLRLLFEAMVRCCQIAARMSQRDDGRRSIVVPGSIGAGSAEERTLIRAGQRAEAINQLREWLESSAHEYLKVCDPFFGVEDLELLQLVLAVRPGLRVQVLTSLKHQEQERLATPYDETYRSYWRSRLSDQEPPEAEIYVVGTADKHELPIHDRWWLSKETGLRMGTSFRSLGVGKDAELSRLSREQCAIFEKDVDRFLVVKEREHQGVRVRYLVFTM